MTPDILQARCERLEHENQALREALTEQQKVTRIALARLRASLESVRVMLEDQRG